MNRKGLSPLIAVVLVIAFTLAVAGIISTWITTFARDETEQLSDTGSTTIDCAESKLFFAAGDVSINKSESNNVKITITNEGTVNQTDFQVSLTDDDGDLSTNESVDNNNETLKPGGQLQLTWAHTNDSKVTNARVATGADDDCPGTGWNVDL